MSKIRAYLRLIGLLVATPAIYSLYMPSQLLVPFGYDNTRWKHWVLTKWGKALTWISGIKLTVIGEKPPTPYILVSNHLSYVDTFIYMGLLDLIYISKAEVRDWFVFGGMMASMGMIFVDRSSRRDVTRVTQLMRDAYKPGQGIVFFPEATTSDGSDVLPFKGSLLSFPASEELPVHYATISYETMRDDQPESEYVHWWSDMTFFTHLLQLLGMQKFYATVKFGDQTILSNDRKELAKLSYDLVRNQYLEIKQN